jgi:hypothetical protein
MFIIEKIIVLIRVGNEMAKSKIMTLAYNNSAKSGTPRFTGKNLKKLR